MNSPDTQNSVVFNGPTNIGNWQSGNGNTINKQVIEESIGRELDALMAETTRAHHELRELIRQLQSDLEAPDRSPKPGFGAKLKETAQNLQLTEKAVTSAGKISDYLDQLGGMF